MHVDIFSTQCLPFPNYISHVVLCPYTQKVRMMVGGGGGTEKPLKYLLVLKEEAVSLGM